VSIQIFCQTQPVFLRNLNHTLICVNKRGLNHMQTPLSAIISFCSTSDDADAWRLCLGKSLQTRIARTTMASPKKGVKNPIQMVSSPAKGSNSVWLETRGIGNFWKHLQNSKLRLGGSRIGIEVDYIILKPGKPQKWLMDRSFEHLIRFTSPGSNFQLKPQQ